MLGDGEEKGLDDIIKKKKVEIFNMNPKHLVSQLCKFKGQLANIYNAPLGEYSDFQVELQPLEGGQQIVLEVPLGSVRRAHTAEAGAPRPGLAQPLVLPGLVQDA